MGVVSLLKALMVAAPISLFASASLAVPITFDFATANVTGSPLNFSSGGVNLSVTAYTYSAPQTLNAAVLVDQSTNGLGVCGSKPVGSAGGCGTSPMLDGGSAAGNDNELLKFTFSSVVTLQSVSFSNNDTNDLFDFFLGDPLTLQFSFLTPIQGQRDYIFANPAPLGSIFAIGLTGDSDQLRIAGMTVLYDVPVVPLPAGFMLLISALAALVGVGRWSGERQASTYGSGCNGIA